VKAVLVVADGMADVPLHNLEGKTPLEVAQKPSIDQLASDGICGMINVIAPGVPPGSDTAHLALLGYEVEEVYSGRGALEAIGSEIDILPTDLAFRCNFATVDDNFKVIDRRAGRIDNEDATELARAISNSLREDPPDVGDVLFKNTIEHRSILRIGGSNLSVMVSDTDPHQAGVRLLEARPLDRSQEAKETADILNTLTQRFHKVLRNHPVNEKRRKKDQPAANIVLCRGVGQLPEIDPLPLLYGINPAAIAAVPLVKGVCKTAGMRLIPVKGATGTYETNTVAKARAAVNALKLHDFILIHIKATDLASHDYKPQKKIKMIEKVDAAVAHLLKNIDRDETFLAVTADHTTSSVRRQHSGEPVPVSITGPYVRNDDVKKFGERTCAKGGLGHIRGVDLMPILMNLLGKTEKAGS
jgi:2,3-bisphosphoglycerate-independent phosphoglycerate mutase